MFRSVLFAHLTREVIFQAKPHLQTLDLINGQVGGVVDFIEVNIGEVGHGGGGVGASPAGELNLCVWESAQLGPRLPLHAAVQ